MMLIIVKRCVCQSICLPRLTKAKIFFNPSMILYFLQLHASNFLVVHDKTEEQLGLYKQFESVEQQLLHNVLLEYMAKAERTDFLEVVRDIYDHTTKHKLVKDGNAKTDKIKEKMIEMILNKFELGVYDQEMLGFAKEFDIRLGIHLEIILGYKIAEILTSATKQFADYKPEDRSINSSLGLLALVYINLVSEIIWYQRKHKKWVYIDSIKLNSIIGAHVGENTINFELIFQCKEDSRHDEHFTFKSIVNAKDYKKPIEEWFAKNKKEDRIIYVCYSQAVMYDALKRDAELDDSKEEHSRFYLENNQILSGLHDVFMEVMSEENNAKRFLIQCRNFLKYDYYDYMDLNQEEFEDWQSRVMATEQGAKEIEEYVEIWLFSNVTIEYVVADRPIKIKL